MMKMLEAGGIPPLVDNLRMADEDNPKGYYEFERVKKLREGDLAWLPEAQGRVVKVISALLMYLPPTYHYRVLFMQRALAEVLASQREMLIRRGEDANKVSEEELTRLYEKHLAQVTAWLQKQPNFSTLFTSYNELITAPWPVIKSVNQFLGGKLDMEKMAVVIDPSLYRQRR